MKISIIGPAYPYRGGISHYTTLLTKELRKKHGVDLISFKRQFSKLFYPGKSEKDYTSQIKTNCVYLLDSLNPFTWIKVFNRIRKSKSDLVIFQWWTPFFTPQYTFISFLIKKFTKSKVLSLCHNVIPHERRRFLDENLTKLFFRNCDCFIVHSEEEKENLNNLIRNPIVVVFPHPSYSVFATNMNKEDSKKEIGIDEEKIILFFGLIRSNKGLMYLIKAMPNILKEIKVKLLIVGEFFGESRQKYTNLIEKLNLKDNIKIIEGYAPDGKVGMYFSASDVVILPYISGTGSGILQVAFGLNKPVICTNVSFSNDVKDNKTGFVVKKEDSGELANAIIKFYKRNLEKEFIKNIKKENQKFSWDKMADALEKSVSKNFK